MIFQNISIIILSVFVNPIQLGLYYGANRIYRAFNSLYSPISQAFFPIISSINNKNKTESLLLIRKYLLLIIIIGLLFFLTNYFLAEEIILIFLGNEFSASNNLLKLFSIVLPLTAVSNALGRQWLMVINKDFFYSFVQLFSSLIALITFLFFINGFGIKALPISLIAYETSAIIMILIFLISYGRT
jgi:Polysaccharide biosynthesis protein.